MLSFINEGPLNKCPKQERSRRVAALIAETVRQDAGLLAETFKTRLLPVSRFAEVYPRKALEKYRHYIESVHKVCYFADGLCIFSSKDYENAASKVVCP